MAINFNMFGVLVKHKILGNIESGPIVTEQLDNLWMLNTQIKQ